MRAEGEAPVGEIPARLDRKPETGQRVRQCAKVAGWRMVKGGVHLHRVEVST
jgi:hypothetical protein